MTTKLELTKNQKSTFARAVYEQKTNLYPNEANLVLSDTNDQTLNKLMRLGYIACTCKSLRKGEYQLDFTVTLLGLVYAAENNLTCEKPVNKHICPKCDGRGYIDCYRHIDQGVCYLCKGSGRV